MVGNNIAKAVFPKPRSVVLTIFLFSYVLSSIYWNTQDKSGGSGTFLVTGNGVGGRIIELPRGPIRLLTAQPSATKHWQRTNSSPPKCTHTLSQHPSPPRTWNRSGCFQGFMWLALYFIAFVASPAVCAFHYSGIGLMVVEAVFSESTDRRPFEWQRFPELSHVIKHRLLTML